MNQLNRSNPVLRAGSARKVFAKLRITKLDNQVRVRPLSFGVPFAKTNNSRALSAFMSAKCGQTVLIESVSMCGFEQAARRNL